MTADQKRAEASVVDGVRRMVLASTSDCYGRNPDVPFDEESASVIGLAPREVNDSTACTKASIPE